MGSLNFTTVLWLIGPATLGAGQSVEYAIKARRAAVT